MDEGKDEGFVPRLEQLRLDFGYFDNNAQRERFAIRPRARYSVNNNAFIDFETGYLNLKDRNGTVNNYSVKVAWEKFDERWRYRVGGGLELFDESDAGVSFEARAAYQHPIKIEDGLQTSFLRSSISIQHKPLKTSFRVIQSDISSWRIQPQAFWRINPKVDLKAALGLQFFSDSNTLVSPRARLTYEFVDDLTIGASFSSRSNSQDIGSGRPYSTRDITTYGGLLAWEKSLSEEVDCSVSVFLGFTDRRGENARDSNTQRYRVGCEYSPNQDFGFSLSYQYSQNNPDDITINGVNSEGRNINSHSLKSQLLFNF